MFHNKTYNVYNDIRMCRKTKHMRRKELVYKQSSSFIKDSVYIPYTLVSNCNTPQQSRLPTRALKVHQNLNTEV